MSFVKVLLGIFTGLVLLGIAGAVVAFLFFRSAITGIGNAAEASRDDVAGAAAQIATIQLPAGFEPDYTFSAGGYSVAAYKGSDGHSHLILARGPENLDLESQELKNYAEQQSGSRSAKITPVRTFEVTIKGQPATVYVGEGVNSDNEPYRQAYVVFEGKNGPTLITLTRPVSSWNEEDVKQFFGSIQ